MGRHTVPADQKAGCETPPVTSAHTGNGVMADGGREPPKVVPQLNNQGTVVTPGVTQRQGRVRPTQSDSTESKLQTQQSAPTDQAVSDRGDGLATGTERPSGTHSRRNTGQSVPADGRRPAIGPDES